MTYHSQLSQQDLISNDYHCIPATGKQIDYARRIAARTSVALPDGILQDRKALSRWISRNSKPSPSQFSNYPSSKQVAFAERIARIKRRPVPQECFRDKQMMSHWIDSNR